MSYGPSGFPEGTSPAEQQRTRLAALERLRKDRLFDDTLYTPPVGIGLFVELGGVVPDGVDLQADADSGTEPGLITDLDVIMQAMELLESDKNLDDDKFTPPGAQ